jgi:chromosomal replication initiation ATPase DnaA
VTGQRTAVPVHDVVDDVWPRIVEELRALAGDDFAALEPWLARLEPVGLREGRFELLTRSPHAAPTLRLRLGPLLERAVRKVLGAPVHLRIEVDQSLGGALHALGVRSLVPGAATPPTPFVQRPETRLAASALGRLAREARPEFDHVVVEGPSGVGKSLLLSTFLWQRRRRFPRERWRLERAEEFFRDFAAACRDHARASFRGERVAHDGLVLDDLQELSGKLACQEQLVEMLEYLRAQRRPVVVATRPLEGGPREWVPSLRSHLRRGLRVAVPQLSAASRGEILVARARSLRGAQAAALQGLLEQLAVSDVPLARALRAVDAAHALARRIGRTPTPEETVAELGDLLPAAVHSEPFDRVLDRCASFVGVTRDALVQGARTRGAALGRHLAVYLAVEVFQLQRATVRRWLGTLSPSVLPYAKSKIEALRATDRRLDGFVREVAEEIGRGQRFLFS